jgi:hypothetical protein
MRIRYGLEKIMLNNKNTIRCLEYANNQFIKLFNKQTDLNKPQNDFNINNRVKLFMIETMFNVIFGIDLNIFINEAALLNKNSKKETLSNSNLYHTQIVANRFHRAFLEYESFSILKFLAMTISEFSVLWRGINKFKQIFNSNIFQLTYFADPMDWFIENFFRKHLQLYSQVSGT